MPDNGLKDSTGYRIGVPEDCFYKPCIAELDRTKLRGPAPAGLFFGTPTVNADRLLEGDLDAAYIGPIDFAKNSSDISLFPSLGISSHDASGVCILCLKNDLRKISRVAIGAVSSSEAVFAKIILAEKYRQETVFVPVIGSIETMLEKADAALLCGDDVLRTSWKGLTIDLAEDWFDLTETPFVHTICAARKEKFNREMYDYLLEGKVNGSKKISTLIQRVSAEVSFKKERIDAQFLSVDYGFDKWARDGLTELFRYAYFHGILPDIPDIEEFEL